MRKKKKQQQKRDKVDNMSNDGGKKHTVTYHFNVVRTMPREEDHITLSPGYGLDLVASEEGMDFLNRYGGIVSSRRERAELPDAPFRNVVLRDEFGRAKKVQIQCENQHYVEKVAIEYFNASKTAEGRPQKLFVSFPTIPNETKRGNHLVSEVVEVPIRQNADGKKERYIIEADINQSPDIAGDLSRRWSKWSRSEAFENERAGKYVVFLKYKEVDGKMEYNPLWQILEAMLSRNDEVSAALENQWRKTGPLFEDRGWNDDNSIAVMSDLYDRLKRSYETKLSATSCASHVEEHFMMNVAVSATDQNGSYYHTRKFEPGDRIYLTGEVKIVYQSVPTSSITVVAETKDSPSSSSS